MFGPDGPSFWELARQCLSSTCGGYDLLAPKFDHTPFRTPAEVLRVVAAQLKPVESALDLCCGTGAGLEMLEPLARRLVGLDCSAGMLALARQRLPRAELHQGDVLALPFCEEFDLVTTFGSLGHIPAHQEPRFVRLIRQSLRPGGRFLFVTAYAPPPGSRRFWRSQLFNAVMRARNLLWKPPFIMYYLTFLLPFCRGMLEAHGFTVTERPGLFGEDLADLVLVEAIRTP